VGGGGFLGGGGFGVGGGVRTEGGKRDKRDEMVFRRKKDGARLRKGPFGPEEKRGKGKKETISTSKTQKRGEGEKRGTTIGEEKEAAQNE